MNNFDLNFTEFSPKNNSLIDQELATSGLEMSWIPVVAAAAGALIGGIGAAKSASSSNKQAKANQKAQAKYNKFVADYQNAYNKKFDEVEKENYEKISQFNYDQAVKNVKHQNTLIDFQHLQALKQYEKSLAIYNTEKGLNAESKKLALENEEQAIEDAKKIAENSVEDNKVALKKALLSAGIQKQQQKTALKTIATQEQLSQAKIQQELNQKTEQTALAKQNKVIEGIIQDGKAALAAPGRSGKKAKQAGRAAIALAINALDVEIEGSRRRAALGLVEVEKMTGLKSQEVADSIEAIDQTIELDFENYNFNAGVIEDNLKSQIEAIKQNVKQINLDTMVAQLETKSNMMLYPAKGKYIPIPTPPPAKVFIDKMKAIPGYTPQAMQQSVFGAAVSGALDGASTGLSLGNAVEAAIPKKQPPPTNDGSN
jgi:hypothetical protein